MRGISEVYWCMHNGERRVHGQTDACAAHGLLQCSSPSRDFIILPLLSMDYLSTAAYDMGLTDEEESDGALRPPPEFPQASPQS